MAAICAGLQAAVGNPVVDPVAAKYDMAAITWDPMLASSTDLDVSTTYTSGTVYLSKLLYPFDRISYLGRYFGSIALSGSTGWAVGFVIYSCDGSGADITTLTKVATLDLTSNAGTSGNRHAVSVTGLTPGNAVWVGFLPIGVTAGRMRQAPGGGGAVATVSTGPNLWASQNGNASMTWATSSAANMTGLTALASAASTVAFSTLTGAGNSAWPCIGLRP